MPSKEPKQPVYVAYHAFADDEAGDTTYTDDPALIRGWNVHVRTEPDPGGQIDIIEEVDVFSEEDAAAAAEQLATKHKATHIEKY